MNTLKFDEISSICFKLDHVFQNAYLYFLFCQWICTSNSWKHFLIYLTCFSSTQEEGWFYFYYYFFSWLMKTSFPIWDHSPTSMGSYAVIYLAELYHFFTQLPQLNASRVSVLVKQMAVKLILASYCCHYWKTLTEHKNKTQGPKPFSGLAE